MKTIFVLIYTCSTLYISAANDLQISLPQWLQEANALPYFRDSSKWTKAYMHKVDALTADEFKYAIDQFIASEKTLLQRDSAWVNNEGPEDAFFTQEEMKKQAKAASKKDKHEKVYAQKVIVPPGSQIAFQGDIHGDIKGLLAFISYLIEHNYLEAHTLKIKKDNFYIGFLGDYTDRGMYGIEVIYTILRLKMQNPTQVFLVRGNHETHGINAQYGLHAEIITKFGGPQSDEIIPKLNTMYRVLPVVVYLGTHENGTTNYVQCNHGGIELGYMPLNLVNADDLVTFEWIEKLSRSKAIELIKLKHEELVEAITDYDRIADHENKLDYNQPNPYSLGFMWNDFIASTQYRVKYTGGRGWEYGEELTKAYLNIISTRSNNVRAIFRAHQHVADWNPLMEIFLNRNGNLPELQGIAKLWYEQALHKGKTIWDGMVATFLVAPDTTYGKPRGTYTGFYYNAVGILTTKPKFEDWHLQTIFITHDELKKIEYVNAELKNLKEWIYTKTHIESQLAPHFLRSMLSTLEQKLHSLSGWLSKVHA